MNWQLASILQLTTGCLCLLESFIVMEARARRSLNSFDRPCMFCGATINTTNAHIVAGNKTIDYSPFQPPHYKTELNVKSPRNFLRLCGTEGMYNTCYDEFDKFRITLLYNPFEQAYVIFCLDLVNSPKANLHGQRACVDKDYPPYRRLLAWRSRKCLLEHGSCMEDKGARLLNLSKFSDVSRSVAGDEDVTETSTTEYPEGIGTTEGEEVIGGATEGEEVIGGATEGEEVTRGATEDL